MQKWRLSDPSSSCPPCGSDTSALTGNQTNVSDYDQIIAAGPKADPAVVDANAWAKKIKDRGLLKTGGSDSGPLFSMKDPSSGKLTGLDAGLAQLLSHYITGLDDGPLDLTITTVDTRGDADPERHGGHGVRHLLDRPPAGQEGRLRRPLLPLV